MGAMRLIATFALGLSLAAAGGCGRAPATAAAPLAAAQPSAASLAGALTANEAMALAALPLACLDHPQAPPPAAKVPYLWAPAGPPRLLADYAAQRAFYGCYDWHSAVNSTWTLATILRRFPQLPIAPLIRMELDSHLGAKNIAGELQFFQSAKHFEMPYGRAFLLKLDAALLGWNDAGARRWAANLSPLARLMAQSLTAYYDRLPYPIRSGVHPNTAWSMSLALDYADAAHDRELGRAIAATARRDFLADRDCNVAMEPGGPDFLSPCLAEGEIMSRLLPQAQFVAWLDGFLPPPGSPAFAHLTRPFDTAHMTKDQMAAKSHLIGLAFSRAESLERIASALPPRDPRADFYRRQARAQAQAGFQGLVAAGYLGSHWLATYAVMYAVEAPAAAPAMVAGGR